MSSRIKKIHDILTQSFKPSELQIEDESWKHASHAGAKESGGGHFVVYISAEIFSGKSTLACHRMINQALKDEFGACIHALSIHCKSP